MQFWDFTIMEVQRIVSAHQTKEKEQFKLQILTNYALAQNIAQAINHQLNGTEPPSLYETYPGLFDEYKDKSLDIDDEKKRELSWQMYKEQMIDFANYHNKKNKERRKIEK